MEAKTTGLVAFPRKMVVHSYGALLEVKGVKLDGGRRHRRDKNKGYDVNNNGHDRSTEVFLTTKGTSFVETKVATRLCTCTEHC